MDQERIAARRAGRATHYGNLIEKQEVAVKKDTKSTTYDPVSHEVTPYGAKKFRTPVTKDEFVGHKGSPIPAYILDIDGTLQNWGSSADKKVMEWVKKLYDEDPHAVFLVITARDHGGFGYTTSFNWLMHNFPYPFIGPFARAVDDPRYASEFKREIAEGFEQMGLYTIMGAADDNKFVIDMWKHWAQEHFENPADFKLLECSYTSYDSWRSDLPSKGTTTYSYGGSYQNAHKDEHWEMSDTLQPDGTTRKYAGYAKDDAHPGYTWVAGATVGGVYIKGHWEENAEAKHRPAGTSRWEKNDDEPSPGHAVDLSDDPRWAGYFAARYGKSGQLPKVDRNLKPGEWPRSGLNIVSTSPNEPVDELDAVLDDIEEALKDSPYVLNRSELESLVVHDHPGYTPAEIESMDLAELRELAGITDADYRVGLIQEVQREFGENRYSQAELDLLSTTELEVLLTMSTADADELVDSIWLQTYGDEAQTYAQEIGKYRLTLEEDVYAEYPDLTYHEIGKMTEGELEILMDAAAKLRAAQNKGPDTAPLDVREVLGNLTPEEQQAHFQQQEGAA